MTTGTRGPWRAIPWFLLSPPEPGNDALRRPRLTARLEQLVLSSPITILSAPSGYGKTVTAADWARSRPDTQWLSAVHSLDTVSLIRGGLLASLSAHALAFVGRTEPEEESSSVLEALATRTSPLTIVIDDAHLLSAEVVRTLILDETILRSGVIRVVLIGQAMLRAHYARELTSGLAATLGAEDLAFDEAETGQLLRLVSAGSAISDSLASEVRHTSGGWAIAIRLAGTTLNGRQADAPGPTLAGDAADSLLSDYIATTLLGALPADLTDFILDTTTCARIDAALAERLSARADSAALLETCIAQGLFLDRFGAVSGQVVYRWHETFARHCQLLSARQDPARARQRHRDAAEHLADAFPAEAIQHAVAADAPELAVQIITRSWLRLILDAHVDTLHSLCLSLPEAWRESPAIALIRACCLDLAGDAVAATLLRDSASRAAGAAGAASDDRLAFVQSFAEVLLTPDPEKKAAAADRAYDLLSAQQSGAVDPHALFVLGWAELRLRRDPPRAVEVLTAAQHEATRTGLAGVARMARDNATFAAAYAGDFAVADTVLQAFEDDRLDASTAWDRYDGGVRGLTRSYIDYWRGDFASALEQCDRTIDDGGTSTSFLGLALVYRVLAIAALGETSLYTSAEHTLGSIPEYDKHGVPWGAYRRMAGARLLEVQGRFAEARKVADPLLNRSGIAVTHALLADFYRRIDHPEHAYLALSKIQRRERPQYAHVSALTTLAALKYAAGERESAHSHCERALEHATRESVLAPFLSADVHLTELLAAHARTGTPGEGLLATIFTRRDRVIGRDLQIRLTRRERELLGHLRTTMTAQEIADRLHLSLATVKTHQRTLYRKLGVNSRREAIRSTQ